VRRSGARATASGASLRLGIRNQSDVLRHQMKRATAARSEDALGGDSNPRPSHRSVDIFTAHWDQHRRWLTCGDLLSILRLLSLLSGHVRPKSGQPGNQPHRRELDCRALVDHHIAGQPPSRVIREYPLITGSVSPIGHAGLHGALGHLGRSDRLGSADGHAVQSSDDRLGSDRGSRRKPSTSKGRHLLTDAPRWRRADRGA
jgi:hypothetical protein